MEFQELKKKNLFFQVRSFKKTNQNPMKGKEIVENFPRAKRGYNLAKKAANLARESMFWGSKVSLCPDIN